MTDAIRAAIEASRERDKKATGVPWVNIPIMCERGRGYIVGPDAEPLLRDRLFRREEDAAFVASARAFEPRFREALAIAVEALANAGCSRGAGRACPCRICTALPRIERILAGEGI